MTDAEQPDRDAANPSPDSSKKPAKPAEKPNSSNNSGSGRTKQRWSQDRKGQGKRRRGPGRPAGANTAAINKAERRLKKKGGRRGGAPGIPQAVERGAGVGKAMQQTPARLSADDNARVSWQLDVLAWAGHGVVAPKVDLRGPSAPLPAVILPKVGDTALIALEPVDAIRKLRSRHRAFSQMAGRYSALVLAARDTERQLTIELWDLDAAGNVRPPDESMARLWPQLATYLEAQVTIGTDELLRERLALAATGPLPEALTRRNPVAWGLQLGASAKVVSDQPADEPADETELVESAAVVEPTELAESTEAAE
ncbi:MAG: hypothetical protein KC502_12325 [Myxococcales bacterium]|nr:hypothetical protein [Myxococcales bacterium]